MFGPGLCRVVFFLEKYLVFNCLASSFLLASFSSAVLSSLFVIIIINEYILCSKKQIANFRLFNYNATKNVMNGNFPTKTFSHQQQEQKASTCWWIVCPFLPFAPLQPLNTLRWVRKDPSWGWMCLPNNILAKCCEVEFLQQIVNYKLPTTN